MCTGAEVAVIAQVVGTVAGVAGAIQQGKAAKDAADYNAAVARNQAIAERQKAQFDADRDRDATRRLLSLQNAQFLASGVEVSGTPLLVMSDQAAQGELDAQAIIYGGTVRAQGFENEATMQTMRGKAAQTSSYFKAGGSLLTGGGKALKSAGKLPTSSPLYFSSDRRLKKNIRPIGEMNGHKFYAFEYVWGGPVMIGVMAQEVMKYLPEAVSWAGRWLQVDYSKLGIIENG